MRSLTQYIEEKLVINNNLKLIDDKIHVPKSIHTTRE